MKLTKLTSLPTLTATMLLLSAACSDRAPHVMTNYDDAPQEKPASPAGKPTDPAKLETATLGAGCFWCVEAVYQQVDGVQSVQSGYMGGHVKNPTYEQICGKKSGHAEVVQVKFDPKKVSYEKILAWFWKLHDPTTLNRQGNDEGPQYRSAIFYHSDAQKQIATKSRDALQASGVWKRPIVTEITAASTFWKAEKYHQNYYRDNKRQNYCRFIIAPKLDKLGLKQ